RQHTQRRQHGTPLSAHNAYHSNHTLLRAVCNEWPAKKEVRSFRRRKSGVESKRARYAQSKVFSAAGQFRTDAMQQRALYSISSSARSRIDWGTARPIALAVLRFTTISYFVGN